MKAKSGGGTNSRVVKQVGQRLGSPSKVVNPPGASQLGQQMGNHAQTGPTGKNPATPLYGGKAEPFGVKLGNEIAQNVGRGAPGAGRTVHARGGQGQHGSVNPGSSPMPRDILSEFGPERRK